MHEVTDKGQYGLSADMHVFTDTGYTFGFLRAEGANVQGGCVGRCELSGPGWASNSLFDQIGYNSCVFVVVRSLA